MMAVNAGGRWLPTYLSGRDRHRGSPDRREDPTRARVCSLIRVASYLMLFKKNLILCIYMAYVQILVILASDVTPVQN
jgi:hypothetical protein